MKLSFSSLIFKTLGLLFVVASIFIFFILFIVKNTFSDIYFLAGIFVFTLAMIFFGVFLYSSLKKLRILASSLQNFNPYDEKAFLIKMTTNDEIGTISRSANIMVNKLKSYIKNTKHLNETIIQKEAHLKEAQRIAKVGSWEYNVVENELRLSDEVYRILGVRFGTVITWDDFLAYISKEDKQRVLDTLKEAVKHGSKFNIKYALILQNKNEIFVQTKGKVRKKQGGHVRITAVTLDITNDIQNKQTNHRKTCLL